jgi:hypothetical protein
VVARISRSEAVVTRPAPKRARSAARAGSGVKPPAVEVAERKAPGNRGSSTGLAPSKKNSLECFCAPESSPRDGKVFMGAAMKDIAARVKRGEKVKVAFDIDDTLADTRVRTLQIAKAWDTANGTHFFDRLTLAQVGHSGLDTARALNLPWEAEKAFDAHWQTAFWDGASFVHDAPIPAVVELAKQAKAAGADVIFLTGRIQSRETATIDQLKRFGLEANHRNVVSKPDLNTRTVPFKAQWIEQTLGSGTHLAFFLTESRRDIAGIQAKVGQSAAVLLDSPFGGTDAVRADTPIYPRAV